MQIKFDSFIKWPRVITIDPGSVGSSNFSAWVTVSNPSCVWNKAVYLDVFIYPMSKTVRYHFCYNDAFRLDHAVEDIALEGMLEMIREKGIDLEGYTYVGR